MTIEFRDASTIPASDWDLLVSGSPDGWVWALSGWQRLIMNVPEWSFREHSFVALDAGRLVAVMPLQFDANSSRMGSSAWGVAGPVIGGAIAGAERLRLYGLVLREAENRAKAAGAKRFELGSSPLIPSSLRASWGVNPLVGFGYHDASTNTRILDLSIGLDALWSGVSDNARRKIKKARARGIEVRRIDWLSSVDAYYSAHVATYTRTGVRPHPRAYFEGIAREMAPHGHAVLHAGFDGGRPTAFRNDARFGEGVLYHTGCSFDEALDSGVNYLLVWASIESAVGDGYRWYEIGEVFPGATHGKEHGLTEFKSRFGGELHRYFKAFKTFDDAPTVETATATPAQPTTAASAEETIREAYARGSLYDTARICRQVQHDAAEYVDRLLADKLNMVAGAYGGGTLVDLCCASGSHALEMSKQADRVIGIDFTARYLESARSQAATDQRANAVFLQADARQLPLATGAIPALYCLSSLYAIPRAAEVIAEVGRVLAPGGRAVLDFGNRRSLNVFCLRYYTDWPSPHPMSLSEIRRALSAAGLIEEERRCFQLLPLWAGRPSWLWPLLHPIWKTMLKRRAGGYMLDEWISSLPGVRAFAFRHVIRCRKQESRD